MLQKLFKMATLGTFFVFVEQNQLLCEAWHHNLWSSLQHERCDQLFLLILVILFHKTRIFMCPDKYQSKGVIFGGLNGQACGPLWLIKHPSKHCYKNCFTHPTKSTGALSCWNYIPVWLQAAHLPAVLAHDLQVSLDISLQLSSVQTWIIYHRSLKVSDDGAL